jgi:hypothetical protein
MSERVTRTLVTFLHPFSFADIGEQSAGTYTIETVEELLPLSFVAYRRLSTTIELPAVGTTTLQRQIVAVDPADIAQAQEKDARPR